MVTPDPSLGISAAFDSAGFRNAIKFAMQMGMPNDPERRPVFVKKSSGRTYFLDGIKQELPPLGTLRLDRDGRPFNPDVKIVQTADEKIAVDCAIEVVKADADELPVGSVTRPTKVVVTLLDTEYALVSGCQELIYNADRYIYGYEPEANGLFDAGIHTMVFYALDES